jgi:hypothetical protein
MEVNTVEEGKVNNAAGEEVAMEDMEYAKVKSNIITPK